MLQDKLPAPRLPQYPLCPILGFSIDRVAIFDNRWPAGLILITERVPAGNNDTTALFLFYHPCGWPLGDITVVTEDDILHSFEFLRFLHLWDNHRYILITDGVVG